MIKAGETRAGPSRPNGGNGLQRALPKLCRGRAAGPLAILAAVAVLAGAVAFLLLADGLPGLIAAHAALMVAAWAGLLPAGALVARYFKVTRAQAFPRELDNQFWWNWHRRLQYAGVGLSLLGAVAILRFTGGDFGTTHGRLGLLLVLLSLAQVAGGALRGTKGGPTDGDADPDRPETWRGDHFDMTRHRLLFEGAHKLLGWGMLALAAVTVVLGVALLGMPDGVMIAVGGAYVVLVLGALDAVKDGRRIDTYVAIWGPRLRSPLLRPGIVPPPMAPDAVAGGGATGDATTGDAIVAPGPERRAA